MSLLSSCSLYKWVWSVSRTTVMASRSDLYPELQWVLVLAVSACFLASGYRFAHNICRAYDKSTKGGWVLSAFLSHQKQLRPTQWRGSNTCVHMYNLAHRFELLHYKQPLFGSMVLWVHMSEMRSIDKGRGPFRPWEQAQVIGSGHFRVPGK